MRATHALIYLNHLRHNFCSIKKQAGKNRVICSAVKANGYGHGAVMVATTLVTAGSDRLSVATVSEARELRQAGIVVPLHLFSLCMVDEVNEAIDLNIIPFICSIDEAKLWQEKAAKKNKKVTVHIKLDTGMGRIGCQRIDLNPLFNYIQQQPNIFLEGLASHFAQAESNADETCNAYNRFKEAINHLPRALPLYHIANSAATLALDDGCCNMVRPGIALYGYHPNPLIKNSIKLKEVMELNSAIVFIKKMKKGSRISYGGHFTLQEDSYIATIPIGYADGYRRLLSSRADVLIKERRYPVVGNICMDQLMVNLGTRLYASLYDKVTLFGPNPLGPNADELSTLMQSISYELLTSISSRVPRIAVDEA